MSSSVSRTAALSAVVLLVPLAHPLARAGEPARGRVFHDPDRNLVEQREAARLAADRVAMGDPVDVARVLADPSAWVRDAALDALVARCDAAAFERLEPLLAHDDPLIAGALAEAAGLRRHAPAREALERLARTRPEEVALEAVWALEALAQPASADALEHVLQRRREPRLRGDALVALAAADPARAADRAREALRDRDVVLRIAALQALLRAAPADAVRAATEVVRDVDGDDASEARVLHAALGALRAWSEGPWAEDRPDDDRVLLREAIDALVSRLAKVAPGRPQAEVLAALSHLARSGPSADDDAREWRAWWAAARPGFVPPDRPAEGRAASAGDAGGSRVRFHGLPVVSTRVVFAQDVSGGMRGPLDPDDPRSPSRLAFSIDELRRVLGELQDPAWVDVAFFATTCRRAAGRLVPIGRARRPLIDFVTRTGGAIPSAQGQARSNLHDSLATLLLDDRIDTVYLLSEGGPTEGRFVAPDRVLRHLGRLNAYAQVRLHCLQVTENRPGARFLAVLARQAGGEFHTLEALRSARR